MTEAGPAPALPLGRIGRNRAERAGPVDDDKRRRSLPGRADGCAVLLGRVPEPATPTPLAALGIAAAARSWR